jgi:hypothetical protein
LNLDHGSPSKKTPQGFACGVSEFCKINDYIPAAGAIRQGTEPFPPVVTQNTERFFFSPAMLGIIS